MNDTGNRVFLFLVLVLICAVFVRSARSEGQGRAVEESEPRATESREAAAADPPRAAKRDGFRVELPDGARIEFSGVGEHPMQGGVEGSRWWRPDGTWLNEPVRSESSIREYELEFYPASLVREVAVKFQIGEGASVKLDCETQPGGRCRSAGTLREADAIYASYALPGDARTMTVKVLYAAGRWKLAGRCDRVNGGPGGRNVFFSPLAVRTEPGAHVLATVTHILRDDEVRIVALDRSGAIHPATLGSTWSHTQVIQEQRQLMLGLEDIAEVRFEARPWQWIEFRNVTLHSIHRSDVEVFVEGSRVEDAASKP
jgi:hypothetical protein